MTETITNGYSFDSTQRELSNEYHHDRVKRIFIFVLLYCALDESNLSSRRVNPDSSSCDQKHTDLFLKLISLRDLGIGGGFRWVLWFPLLRKTGYSRISHNCHKCDEKRNSKVIDHSAIMTGL